MKLYTVTYIHTSGATTHALESFKHEREAFFHAMFDLYSHNKLYEHTSNAMTSFKINSPAEAI